MEIVQNEVENDDADEEDLKITEAKKMWWHAKLECGVVELYSKEALEWYRNTLNKMGNKFRAWSCQEKPDPRLKVWIKPQFAHLTAEKYIQLCLKYHPKIKGEPWKLESVSNEEGLKRTAYLRTSQALFNYLQQEGPSSDKFSVKGFCGVVVFATAKESPAPAPLAPAGPQQPQTNGANGEASKQSGHTILAPTVSTPTFTSTVKMAISTSHTAKMPNSATPQTTTTTTPTTTRLITSPSSMSPTPLSRHPKVQSPISLAKPAALQLPPPLIPTNVETEIRILANDTNAQRTKPEENLTRRLTTTTTTTPTTATTTTTSTSAIKSQNFIS